MSLTVAKAQNAPSRRTAQPQTGGVRATLDIALVNNMPDGAFVATERQFTAVLQSAAVGVAVRLHLFALPTASRGPDTVAHIARQYRDYADLLSRRYDGVVVTGAEPRAPRLSDEPYWREFGRLVDWADRNTLSSVWSCLAAHAAVLHLDGVTRVPLARKLAGIYAVRVATDGLRGPAGAIVHVPHSRLNGLRRADLVSCGYRVLSESDATGVDVFTTQRRSRLVFLQGHPEYEADTLMREFRRDVGRYLRGERTEYPDEPADYFSAEAETILRAFKRRALTHRDPKLFDVFPNVGSPFALVNRWHAATQTLFRNWLTEVLALKQRTGVAV